MKVVILSLLVLALIVSAEAEKGQFAQICHATECTALCTTKALMMVMMLCSDVCMGGSK